MKRKIVIFNVIIITLALLAMFFFGIQINKKSHQQEAETEIVQLTQIYAQNYSDKITENVPTGIRVTVIDSNNLLVIADSEDSAIVHTSHADRQEVIDAMNGTPKVVTRYSSSVNKNLVYYALKVESANVIVRVAISVETVTSYTTSTLPALLIVLFIALVFSYVASIVATHTIIKPLESIKHGVNSLTKGNYVKVSTTSSDKEVNAILDDINSLGEELENNIKNSNLERQKLKEILTDISDGIIVVNINNKIDLINKNASDIFGITDTENLDISLENFDKELYEKILINKDKYFNFTKSGKTFQVYHKVLENGIGIIVFTDISSVKDNEKMRSEFFANASHELKTPLTAIKGFNDIITLSTADEKTKELSGKIDKELNRIIALINDMLNLSKLEAKTQIVSEDIQLLDTANEAKDTLSKLAEDKNINVEIDGAMVVNMEREHAFQLVKNLMENAIRYNNNGGYVKVKMAVKGSKKILSVEDNGIGIAKEHQERIFERFYRINKSRSRETGGTGLGLSIVKHICSLYNATISLKSEVGKGTTITITM